MLTLYVKTGCAYSSMVLHELQELALSFTEKNIGDDATRDELIARSGLKRTPYLVDDETGVEVSESGAIVAYILQMYGGEKAAEIKKVDDLNICLPENPKTP